MEDYLLKDRVLTLLKKQSGLTDREITNILLGKGQPQQRINQICRSFEKKHIVNRHKRDDGLIGNYYMNIQETTESELLLPILLAEEKLIKSNVPIEFAEDNIKRSLVSYLEADGWKTQVAWGRKPGIDINATRGNERWIFEVKGLGSTSQVTVNYFLGVLSETLQRMDDPNAKYSIVLPDVKQFRNLWMRLPILAKERTGISVLFINNLGDIREDF